MSQETEAYGEVLEVIERYVEGCGGPDADKIRSAFHENAQLFGRFGGKTVVFPIEAWIDRGNHSEELQ